MEQRNPTRSASCYALVALAVFLASRIVYSAPILYLLTPILIVVLLEKRRLSSLGFTFDRKRAGQYLAYAVLGFVSQVLVLAGVVFLVRDVFGEPYELSMPPSLLAEFLDQLYLVGLPEEVFYRGYLQTRLADWLGSRAGYLLSALIFGLAHVVGRVQQHGIDYLGPAMVVGAGALAGALVFGYALLRTRSLYPSIVAHIATNMFASGIVGLVLG